MGLRPPPAAGAGPAAGGSARAAPAGTVAGQEGGGAGRGPAQGQASPGRSAPGLVIGALAVLVAASNGFAKAYSP